MVQDRSRSLRFYKIYDICLGIPAEKLDQLGTGSRTIRVIIEMITLGIILPLEVRCQGRFPSPEHSLCRSSLISMRI